MNDLRKRRTSGRETCAIEHNSEQIESYLNNQIISLAKGFYFLQLTLENDNVVTTKILKQ